MNTATGYGPNRDLTIEEWIAVIDSWPRLVRTARDALQDADSALMSAKLFVRGRYLRMEACGFSGDLCRQIAARQRKHAQRAVRRAMFALVLLRALHPKRATASV